MGTVVFRRPVRPPAPASPAGEVHLEAPPEVPRVVPTSPVMRLLPLVMVVASVGFVVVMGVSNPTSWLVGGMVALSTVGMVAGGSAKQLDVPVTRLYEPQHSAALADTG